MISIALHAGSAIEGGIGSELKVDATYLSSEISIASRIAYYCEDYNLPLLISDNIYNLLTPTAQGFLRKIVVILMAETKEPLGLFTFDLSQENCEVPEGHALGAIIPTEEARPADLENCKTKSADMAFAFDIDIQTLHKTASEIAEPFAEALRAFLSGDWSKAQEWIEQCLTIWESDGPSKVLKEYMERYNRVVPDGWRGYRNLEDLPPAQENPTPVEDVKAEKQETAKEESKASENKPKPKEKKELGAIEEFDEEDALSGADKQ